MSISRRAFSLMIPGTFLGFGAGCSRGNGEISGLGTAFGTEIGITVEESAGTGVLDLAFEEVARLESIFTLFDPQSPLRQLNTSGTLIDPPPELVEVLEICGRFHRLTGGAFDPTVQPLWELYEQHFAENPADTDGPAKEAIAAARNRIGWEKVSASVAEIQLRESGMALTLNGIAPGYVADRVAPLLKAKGVKHALVDTGEFRALGSRPDGSPWRVEINAGDSIAGHVELVDRGLATSAGYATAFDLEQRFHHLFHPDRDHFQPAKRTISVEAPTAAMADALATAGGVMEQAAFEAVVNRLPGARARIFDHRAD